MPTRHFRPKGMLLTLALVLLTILAFVLVASGRGGWRDRLQAASDALTFSETSTSSDASTSSVQTPAGTTPGAASASPTTTQGGGGFLRIVQWLNDQAPQSGGASGALDAAFVAMLEGDCRGALRMSEAPPGEDHLPEPGRTLYEGAGSACLAAFEGRPELWPRAEAAFEKAVTHVSAFDCEQQTVYRLLARLVGLHRTEPNAQLVKEVPSSRGVLKCPHFTEMAPDHGPAEGGYPIYFEGENLPRVVVVNLQSEGGLRTVLKAESIDGRHVTVIAPPASKVGGSIYIWPSGADWRDEYTIRFVYDSPAAKTQPSTTTTKPQVTSSASTTTTTTPSPPSS